MKVFIAAVCVMTVLPATVRAVAPVRNGVIVADAGQFLGELPDGDTANNGQQGGGGGRGGRGVRGAAGGRGTAGAPATAPVTAPPVARGPAPFSFENFSINLRVATPFSAKALVPAAGNWHLYVQARSTVAGNRFKVAVGERVSEKFFGTGAVGSSGLEEGGSFDLSAGPVKVTLTQITPGNAVEAVFLTQGELTEASLAGLQYPEDLVQLKAYDLPVLIDGVKFGDLNGDGKTDLVVLTPNYSTYAYDNSGKELWHYDAPQDGTVQRSEFEAPGSVWDFDHDGKAEVVAWRMIDGKEWLTMADGATGEIKYKVEWPSDPMPHVYNNFRTAVAKLHDGYPDSLIVYTDSGRTVSINAYGPKLNLLWSYSHPRLKDYHGHYIYPVDINGDGIDEVYVSHVMLDAKGKEVWNNYAIFPDNHDHVDSARFIDLNGDGKLELVAGQSDVGTVVYDAQTGKLLWQRFANHNQKIEAGPYRDDHAGPVVLASSRFYVGGLGALLRWYDIDGNRLGIWPNNPVPGNPNFVKGDLLGDGKNVVFWQRFRVERDGTGTLAFPNEVFHCFDFMGLGNDQVITLAGRTGTVRVYGMKGAISRASGVNKDPVYLAHSVSNHTHY